MVMHARKTQRMNDGYFEKHQAHPYQNSKYGSSKAYGSTSDRYDRIRDSPNGNYRSDSPDSQSPRDRDRSYQPKNTYLQKIREKERENRDYKMSRDVKYTDCARSPKDKRIREAEHRTNNDRNDEKGILHPIKVSQNLASRDRKTLHNNSVDKRDERERVIRVGDWSEHVSSSGKKYYYNCKTEVSQWEKPREWIERERDRFRNRERDRERDTERCYSRSGHDKHSNLRPPIGMAGKDLNRDSTGGGRHWTGGGGGSSSSRIDDNDIPLKDLSSRSLSRKQHQQQQQHYQDSDNSQLIQQDMDISPGDSTPTSEVSFTTNSNQINNSCNIDHSNNNITQTSVTATSTTTVGPVLLANALPRLISHPVSSSSSTPCSSTSTTQIQPPTTPGGRSDSSPQSTLSLLSGLQPTTSSSTIISNTPGPPLPPPVGNSGSCLNRISTDNLQQQRQTIIGDSVVHTSLSVDVNHTGTVVEGPPTPTHSETPDCSKVTIPVSSPPGGSGGGNLSSLQGMSSSLQALRPQGPTITPSLANHYRDDLVNHVRGWPAEILEKQAQKLAEEAYYMSSIQCSKVSAELKSARSIVRLTEIQATLQEQRILFLRQQIKELEELKSQNSFMSDDS